MHPSAALFVFPLGGRRRRDNTAYTVRVPNLHICFDSRRDPHRRTFPQKRAYCHSLQETEENGNFTGFHRLESAAVGDG